MPSLPGPLPPRLLVPVELKPLVPGWTLPPLVSIETPMPLSTLPLEMVPLLTSELLELTVTAAVLLVPMPTLPVASMVMLPLVEVLSAVEVAVEISVSARAAAAMAAASRAAAAAESIKRCLINTSLFKMSPGGAPPISAFLSTRPVPGPRPNPRVPRGNVHPFTLRQAPHPPRRAGSAVWHAPLYPAIVPVQQQFLPWTSPPGANLPVLIGR